MDADGAVDVGDQVDTADDTPRRGIGYFPARVRKWWGGLDGIGRSFSVIFASLPVVFILCIALGDSVPAIIYGVCSITAMAAIQLVTNSRKERVMSKLLHDARVNTIISKIRMRRPDDQSNTGVLP